MKLCRKCRAEGLLCALLVVTLASPLPAQTPAAVPAVRPSETQPASPQVSPAQPVPAQSSSSPAQVQTAPAADSDSRSISSNGRMQRDLSPWSMFLAADIVVKAVMVSLGVCFARDLDDLLRQDGTARPHAAPASRRAGPDRRSANVVRSASGAKLKRHRAVGVVARRAARSPRVGRRRRRRRHQGARRVALFRDRARRSALHAARHGDPCHHRRDFAVRRTVRNGVGHHEQFHRHLESADHEPRRGGARHRRSAAWRRPSG